MQNFHRFILVPSAPDLENYKIKTVQRFAISELCKYTIKKKKNEHECTYPIYIGIHITYIRPYIINYVIANVCRYYSFLLGFFLNGICWFC